MWERKLVSPSVKNSSESLQRAPAGSGGTVEARRRSLRVVLATPLGRGGRGGMDRLADMLIDDARKLKDAPIEVQRITTKGGDSRIIGTFYFIAAIAQLLVYLLLRRVDVLHLNMAVQGSFYRKYLLSKLARAFGVPYIAHIHSGRFDEFWDSANRRTLGHIEDMFSQSAQIIVLGNALKAHFVNKSPNLSGIVSVVRNGTPRKIERMTDKPGSGSQLNIVYLGNLTPLKGLPHLLDALVRIKARTDWTATLAGDVGVVEAKRFIEEAGLADRVSVPGWVSPEEVDRLLSEGGIFVLPSLTEGLPMSIIEAFAWGVPVVTTPVGAIPEIIEHEKNGLLVTPGDAGALTGALVRLLDDQELRERLGQAGLQSHQESFSFEAHAREVTRIWRNACQ